MRTHTHQTWDSEGNLIRNEVVAWAAHDYEDAIRYKEEEITPRRLREALLGDEGKSWLEAKEGEIAGLRTELNDLNN